VTDSPRAILPNICRCMQMILELTDEEAMRISPETTPLDLPKWTSLTHVQIVLELERIFEITFESDEIASLASVGAMVEAIGRFRRLAR
jgi:acyl carrier protein